MSDLLSLTGAELVFGTLLVTGAWHLRHRGTLLPQLDQQDLIPRRGRALVASLIGPAEVLVGLLGGLALTRGAGLATATALALLVYGSYAAFAAVLWRRRPGTPCGCAGGDEPISGWVVLRAGLLALVAGSGLATEVASLPWTSSTGAASLPIAVAVGLVIWQLPVAMRSDLPVTRPTGGQA